CRNGKFAYSASNRKFTGGFINDVDSFYFTIIYNDLSTDFNSLGSGHGDKKKKGKLIKALNSFHFQNLNTPCSFGSEIPRIPFPFLAPTANNPIRCFPHTIQNHQFHLPEY